MRSKVRSLLEARQRGFLGPIGDDLPSLIPLVFALMIFFSVFTQTFRTFDERNSLFKDSISVARLSDIFVGSSYIVSDEAGAKQFDEMCKTAQSIRAMNWKAGLIPLDTGHLESKTSFFQGIEVESLDARFFTLPGTGKELKCNNSQEQLTKFSENTIVRFYPVALEINQLKTGGKFYVKPMLMVIVAWK